MKAVAYTPGLPIEDSLSLFDVDIPAPTALERDLVVRVHAVGVNPIDTKVRRRARESDGQAHILGWDVAGEVIEAGPACTLFKPGDKVFYAGSIDRPGCNSEYHVVDERIVGPMPASLSFEQAAALPLTSVTAWECLFDRLMISQHAADNCDKSLLIIGAAGGVGSIAIQLANKLAGLTVIATASRPETVQWVRGLGANHVINHREALAPQLGGTQPDYILCCSDTSSYFAAMADIVKPQGRVCLIVDAAGPVDINLYKAKSAGLAWESMFTRALYRTQDMIEQHHILARIAQLLDAGALKTTLNQTMRPINAAHLRQAHATLEAGSAIGKIVLQGW